jgi:hypothetical protein
MDSMRTIARTIAVSARRGGRHVAAGGGKAAETETEDRPCPVAAAVGRASPR